MGRLNISVGGGGGISSDEVTAVLTDVLEGTTALTSDSNDEIGEGAMLDKSGTSQAAEASLDTTNSRLQMTVPETGKYSTASKLYAAYSAIRTLIGLTAAKIISGNTILGLAGTATSDATIRAESQLLKGVIAYGKNGVKYTGTIASLAAKTYTPGTSNQTIAAGQYLSGAQTIKGDANLKAANIKNGVSIFGITGTYEGYTRPNSTYLYYRGHNAASFALGSYLGRTGTGTALHRKASVLFIGAGSNYDVTCWATASAIDLTNYSSLKVVYSKANTSITTRYLYLFYGTSRTSASGNKKKLASLSTSESSYSFDISDLSGSYYLGLAWALDENMVTEIHEVQLVA